MPPHLRIARPVSDLPKSADMYCRGLGPRIVGSIENQEAFDGVMLGMPGANSHFEFTRYRTHPVTPTSTLKDLVVFYLPAEAEWKAKCAGLLVAGFKHVPSFNPYRDISGRTYEDPDGYHIVLQQAEWTNAERP